MIRALVERVPGLELSTSATTRPPRPGEEDGREYFFLSPDEFERRLASGDFIEHATYAGNRYGTPRSELERDARGLVLEVELQGARKLRGTLPQAVEVFIAPPSLEALRARLVGRGSDRPEEIEERLAVARRELEARSEFRHVVVNDRLEEAVEELVELVDTILRQPSRGASQ